MSELELLGSSGPCVYDCSQCPSLGECEEGRKRFTAAREEYIGITDPENVKAGLEVETPDEIIHRTYWDAEKVFCDPGRILYPFGELKKITSRALQGTDFMKEQVRIGKFFQILKKNGYDINKVLITEKRSKKKYSFERLSFGSSDFEMYSPIKIEEKQITDQHLAIRFIISSMVGGVSYKSAFAMTVTRPAIQEIIQDLLDEIDNILPEREEERAIEEAVAREIEAAVKVAADIASASLIETVTSAVGVVPEITIENTIADIPPKERDYKGAKALAIALGSYISLLMLNTRFGAKPEIICGPVPLYSVQMTERAKSDRKLKNRAIGAVFLAHQKGNRDIFRVDGVLRGPLRYVYLWMLVELQKEGKGKTINLSQSNMPVFAEGVPAAIEEMTTAAKGQLNYEIHQTFPIITQFQILTDMYLQTVEWHRGIEDGQEMIRYHLLFRKYFPTNVWRAFNPLGDESEPLTSSKFKVYSLGRKNRQWIESGIDALWKTYKMFGEIYPHLALQSDGKNVAHIDREALSNTKRLVLSYSGKLLGLF